MYSSLRLPRSVIGHLRGRQRIVATQNRYTELLLHAGTDYLRHNSFTFISIFIVRRNKISFEKNG